MKAVRMKARMRLACVGLLSLTLAAASHAAESAGAIQEGEQYATLPVPIEPRDPGKIEVVEVFSYACIHCRNFQGELEAWLSDAPDQVDFYRMPATFNPAWAALAQAYYAAEALGVTGKVHEAIFSAIHDDNENLAEPARMAEVFEREAGIEPDKFNQVYNSFSVRSRVQQADARGKAYRLTGTPTLIVAGRYRVDGRMAGSNAGMLEVVDHLVAREQAARQQGSTASSQ